MKTKKQNFNGGYIKASQEAYDLLVKIGVVEYINGFNFTDRNKGLNKTYLLVDENQFVGDESEVSSKKVFKQFYINNRALSWDEPKEYDFRDDMYFMSICHKCDKETQHNSIGDGSRYVCTECGIKSIKNTEQLKPKNKQNDKPTQIRSMDDLNELPTTAESDGLLVEPSREDFKNSNNLEINTCWDKKEVTVDKKTIDIKINIPTYRGQKIDSDEYVEGFLYQDYYSFKWFISDTVQTDEIDPSTLAIHFPDMKDSEGTKIFASLSEDGKGGDILDCISEYQKIKSTQTAIYNRKRFYPFLEAINYENKTYKDFNSEFKVTGIQQ